MSTTAKPGMSLNVKIGIAVAALVGLVFVVTFLSMLPKTDINDPNNTGQAELPKPGLTQYVKDMRYMPTSGRAEYREYQQYFETGEHTVPFWLSNSNEVPLTVSFVSTSCTACSLAEFAIVPALPFNPEGDPDPFGAVIGGITGKAALTTDDPPFGLNDVAFRARQRIEAEIPPASWQRLKPPGSTRDDVTDVKQSVEIPAAASADKPTWVIVRLNIKVTQAKVLETHFSCQRTDSPVPQPFTLFAAVVPVEPCEVYPPVIDFKTMSEDSRSAEETVYYWSHTRTHTRSPDGLLTPLPPPDVAVATARLPNVTFTPPVPATRDELEALAKRLVPDPATMPPVRVAAAYKTTLRFNRSVTTDGKTVEADLGPFERVVDLPPDGRGLTLTKTPSTTVRATLLGSVRLAEGRNVKDDKINLGSFNVRSELVRDVVLTSDKPGLELETLPELTEPKYLKLDPDLKAERKGDSTRWTLTLRIDKDVGGGEMKPGSVVVVRIKGTGQLVRIPVTGRGTS